MLLPKRNIQVSDAIENMRRRSEPGFVFARDIDKSEISMLTSEQRSELEALVARRMRARLLEARVEEAGLQRERLRRMNNAGWTGVATVTIGALAYVVTAWPAK